MSRIQTGHDGLRVLAVVNQKGGVGKTTTTINLGTVLAAVNEKILLLDLDPQGNASTGVGVNDHDRTISTFDVLTKTATLNQAAIQTNVPNLFIAPATRDLAGLEPELNNVSNRAFRLRDAIMALKASEETKPLRERFSYILIDCPPSLNILTINALTAADSVLVPVQCEFFALEGITQLKDSIDFVRGNLNPQLHIHGVVLTMHDPRTKLADDVASEVRNFFGDKVYSTIIPRNVRVAEAPSFGKPILLYDHKCAGSQAYIQLATEMIQRERMLGAA